MKKIGNLYELIKSLSDKEQKFVRRHLRVITINGVDADNDITNTSYLFELICSAKINDRKLITEKLLMKGICGESNMKALFYYVYKIVLSCLRTYHASSNDFYKLQSLLTNSRILSEKGLYILANKEIIKAKRLLQNNKLPIERIRFAEEERLNKIHFRKSELNSNMYVDVKDNLSQLVKEWEIFELNDRLFDMRFETHKLNDGSPLSIQLNQLATGKIDLGLHSLNFKINYNYILSLWCSLNEKDDEKLSYSIKNIKIYVDNPEFRKLNQLQYLFTLSNCIGALRLLNRNDEILYYLQLIESEIPQNRKVKFAKFTARILNRFAYHAISSEWKEITKLENQIFLGLDTYKDKIKEDQEFVFLYNLSVAFFAIQDFIKASEIIAMIKFKSRSKIKRIYLPFVKLIRILCAYELNQNKLFETLLKSQKQLLKKTKFPQKAIVVTTQSIEKIYFAYRHEKTELWLELKNEFENISNWEELKTWLKDKPTN